MNDGFDIAPLVRIAMYFIAGWLQAKGLPEGVASMIANDPGIADLVANILAAVVAVTALLWWRIAKRMGWKT